MLTIYKTFVRSHLDYADFVYDKPFNDSFKEKLEKVWYSAALIITGAIKGTSRERLYQELGPESFCDRRWYRKLVFFYKIVKGLAPSYWQSYVLPGHQLFAQCFILTARKNRTNQIMILRRSNPLKH